MVNQLKKRKSSQFHDRLNILLDIAQTINEEHSIEELLSEFEILLLEELEVGKVLVFTYHDGSWTNLLSSGVDANELADINVDRDLIKYSQIENITVSHPKHLKSFDSVIPLFHRYKCIGYVLIGDVDEEHQGISPTIKHLKLIQIISNLIIVFIENKRMQNALIEQESMKKEMELASRIQNQLVPKHDELPVSNKFNISVYYRPQYEVGGDYYDFIKLSNNVLGFCIADVSGKGIAASLIMSNFQAVFRALFSTRISLKKLIYQLNQKVNDSANNEKFITMFLGKYNTMTRKLTYVNAGHLPPLLFDSHRNILTSLDKGCIGLGMLDEIPSIEVGKIKINKGSKFVAFTDGLVELENGDEIESGLENIEEILTNSDSFDKNMIDIKSLIDQHLKEGSVFDDVTVTGIGF